MTLKYIIQAIVDAPLLNQARRALKCLLLITFILLGNLTTAHASGSGTLSDPFTTLADAYTVSSGRYYFNTGSGLFQADVDNSEGGGWLLALQYVHQGGTNPPVSVIGAGSDFPVTSTATLGADESAIASRWGHAGNLAMNQFSGDIELRWYAETGAHSRDIHFRSSVGVDYARTGTGSFGGINTSFVPLTGHSANLPGSATDVYFDQNDYALTNFPFWRGGTYHWGIFASNIGANPATDGFRWEVDDFANNGLQNTIHRIWVRQVNPLVVTNTNDSGEGSLRQAISVANADAALDNITFDIPGVGPHIISVLTQLPALTDTGITIDGATQTGASCGDLWAGTPPVLNVQINDGGTVGIGIEVAGSDILLRGLSITGFNNGISGSSAAANAIFRCNFIGLAPDGATLGNSTGVKLSGTGPIFGGLSAGDGNVVGGNIFGLLTTGGTTSAIIQGNFIGTDPTGTMARANITLGVGNDTGSATVNEVRRNLISGNRWGFAFQADDTWSGVSGAPVSIVGNYIGTNRTGNAALPNTEDGIDFTLGSVSNLVIGGTVPADRNVISGNAVNGIDISNQSDIAILGNYIGLGANGSTALGNGTNGINANGITRLAIGNGTASGRNIIGDNVEDGIELNGTIDDVVIDNNYIGLAADGNTARGNGAGYTGWGIGFEEATSDGDIIRNNVISDNGVGVYSLGGSVTNTVFTGNYLGTDATGLLPRGNEYYAIILDAGTNAWAVGTPASGNIFSATRNDGSGLEIYAGAHTFQNNLIGVGVDGTTALGNEGWGVRLYAGPHVFGGTGPNESNVIAYSGAGYANMLIQNGAKATVSGNTIRDGQGLSGFNVIGAGTVVTFHDNTLSGEAGPGILVESGAQLFAYNNMISGNGEAGIRVDGATTNAALYSNSISNNIGLGIDLGVVGVTVNDSGGGDSDAGPNDLLNFPVVNSFAADGSISVEYNFNLDAPSHADGYRIEFFRNANLESYGEGEFYLGAVDVAHTGGNLNFTGSFNSNVVVSAGDYISATATRKTGLSSFDITSEFAETQTAIQAVPTIPQLCQMEPNLFSNPGFEAGNTGFNSDHVFASPQTGGNRYSLETSPINGHNAFMDFGDHTTGSGNMMVINGAVDETIRTLYQDVSVIQGEDYSFVVWARNAVSAAPAQLQFRIGGVPTTAIKQPLTNKWVRYDFTWTATVTQTVTFSIHSTTQEDTGNDFVLDDIFIGSCSATTAAPLLSTQLIASETVSVFDPTNIGIYALPGNDVISSLTFTNSGNSSTDADSIIIIKRIPDESIFYNGDIDDGGPETQVVSFAQTNGAGLSFNFISDIGFSNIATPPASFAVCNYSPIAGYDENVRYICLNPKGSMQPGNPNPSVTLSYRTQIK